MAGLFANSNYLCLAIILFVAWQISPSDAVLRRHRSRDAVENSNLIEPKSSEPDEFLSIEPKNRFTSFIGDVSQRLRNFLQRIPMRSSSTSNRRVEQNAGNGGGNQGPPTLQYESNQQEEDPFAAHLDRGSAGSSGSDKDGHATSSADNKYAGSPRLFSIFSPYNPLNPFQPLFTEVQNRDSILRKLLKLPSLAAAQLARPADVTTTGGSVQFLQTKDKKDMLVVVAFALPNAFTAGTYRLEVRSGQSNVCANAGGVYNPTGVPDGGVLTRALTGTLTAALVRGNGVFRVDPKIATLYGQSTIIGKTIAIVDPTGAQAACGVIAAA